MRGYSLDDAALRLEGISKRYRLRSIPRRNLAEGVAALGSQLLENARDAFGRGPGSRTRNPVWVEFWALRDLTLEARPGELFGVIGANGAGKSTLFKVIAGVTIPTRGWLAQRGRLGALIEVGAGIHPELTGRENVYQYGSILGLSWREIGQRFDSIVQFADLDSFIDQPVKRYSSGMQMRLGFSVAAHVEPDVLLVDEVLAVGDEAFQIRCLERIESLRRGGTAILLATHDLTTVERRCRQAIWLDHGRLVMAGSGAEVVAAYRAKEQ